MSCEHHRHQLHEWAEMTRLSQFHFICFMLFCVLFAALYQIISNVTHMHRDPCSASLAFNIIDSISRRMSGKTNTIAVSVWLWKRCGVLRWYRSFDYINNAHTHKFECNSRSKWAFIFKGQRCTSNVVGSSITTPGRHSYVKLCSILETYPWWCVETVEFRSDKETEKRTTKTKNSTLCDISIENEKDFTRVWNNLHKLNTYNLYQEQRISWDTIEESCTNQRSFVSDTQKAVFFLSNL